MYNDLNKAEFVLENFKLHNPDISITVYNGGDTQPHLVEKYGVELIEGPNLASKHTRERKGGYSFNLTWFNNFYGLAEKYNPDYMLFLETDVKCSSKITIDPIYDIAGPMHRAGPMEELLIYDYWVNFVNDLQPIGGYASPFTELNQSRWPHRFHTGMGGTAFSRTFFEKTKDKLYLVKNCFEDMALWFHHDVIVSCLARHCGCTIGDWRDVTDTRGSLRFINDQWHNFPYEPDCALAHSWKI